MSIADPISKTARWIAAARAVESRRPDRLFDDPFAADLAGEEGFQLLLQMGKTIQLPDGKLPENPYLAIRTRFIDDFLIRALAMPSFRQVVLVAAGLDARAYRLALPQSTRVFELDRPEVLNFKEETLNRIGAHPNCLRTPVPVDLTAPFQAQLTDRGFAVDQPSIWVLEGLLPYLDDSQARGVVAECSPLAVPGSCLVGDCVGESFLRCEWLQPFFKALEAINAPWKFATDQPEKFFAEFGWGATVRRPGEDGAAYGRWPYPLPPRETPGMPNSFFVTATRQSVSL